LLVRKRRDIGQYQHLVTIDVLRIKQSLVNHLEGYAGLDQRLIIAEDMVLDLV